MKTKYAKKFSRLLLVLAVANAAALGTTPASLQSQEDTRINCYEQEDTGSWFNICYFCLTPIWNPFSPFCGLCGIR